MDFIDLNSAYPKDSVLLLRIDQLVDSMIGHKLLMFMDAFLGYNQIKMSEERPRENCLHHQPGALLLQYDTLSAKECMSNLLKVN